MFARPNFLAPKRGAAGFSLVEMLVAIAIFAVVMVAAYQVYDESQKTFILGEQATDQQQNTRIGFDKMASELALVGFDVNRDGFNAIDEKLEGIFESAIVVRANYNFDDPDVAGVTEFHGRELAYEASPRDYVVTTKNEEIVLYALISDKDGAANGDSITVNLDSTVPRDGTKVAVTLDGIDLTNAEPPYTLNRFNLNAAGDAFVGTPLASSVRSLKFTYYDAGNEAIPDADVSKIGGLEDEEADITFPSGRNVVLDSNDWRSGLTRIGIEVIGMTARPDFSYTDPTETVASAEHYRKFRLTSNVMPINLDMEGEVDGDDVDPAEPTNVQAFEGHCRGLYVTWEAPLDEDIAGYRVFYGTSNPPNSSLISGGQEVFAYVDQLARDTDYYVSIQTFDGAGNTSDRTIPIGPITTSNTTTPKKPENLAAEKTNQEDFNSNNDPAAPQPYLLVTWDKVEANEAPGIPEDVDANGETPWRDYAGGGYKLERALGVDSSGNPISIAPTDHSTFDLLKEQVADTSQLSGRDLHKFIDKTVSKCVPYYYRVRALDNCTPDPVDGSISDGEWSDIFAVPSPYTDAVDAPATPQAPDAGPHNWLTAAAPDPLLVTFTFPRVSTDVSGNTVSVMKYEIQATPYIGNAAQAALSVAAFYVNPTMDPVVYAHTLSPTDPAWTGIDFQVRAVFPCSPEKPGDWSTPPTRVPCTVPSPPLQITDGTNTYPAATDFYAAPITVRTDSTVATSGSTLVSVSLNVKRLADGATVVDSLPMNPDPVAGFDYSRVWDAEYETAGPAAFYEVSVVVLRADGCVGRVTQTIRLISFLCCLQNEYTSATDVVLTPIIGNPKRNLARWQLIMTDECANNDFEVEVNVFNVRLIPQSSTPIPNLNGIYDVTGTPVLLFGGPAIPGSVLATTGATIALSTPITLNSTNNFSSGNSKKILFGFSSSLQGGGSRQHGLLLKAGYIARDAGGLDLPPSPATNGCWVAPQLKFSN